MLTATLLAVVLAASNGPEEKEGRKPQLIVLELLGGGGVPKEVAAAMTEAVVAQVSSLGIFQVLSTQEIATLTGLQRQKQMMGCSEDSSCLAELAGAIGARFVVSGSLAKLGEAYQLSLQTLDSRRAQTIGRSIRLAPDIQTLQAQLPYSVAEATSTPMPPPPSRILPYSLMGVGAAALVAGGFFGLNTLGRERELNQELKLGESTPEVLGSLSKYQAQQAALGRDKTISLAAMVAGAALIGVGVFVLPKEIVSAGGARATLVPHDKGVALVGVFP